MYCTSSSNGKSLCSSRMSLNSDNRSIDSWLVPYDDVVPCVVVMEMKMTCKVFLLVKFTGSP